MQKLIFTIGSGKNGTNALAEMFHVAAHWAPAGQLPYIKSDHEMSPCMNVEEKVVYEGTTLSPEYFQRHSNVFQQWVWLVREHLKQHQMVHHANNHLTCLMERVAAEFTDIDLRIILPIRDDWRACAAALYLHGAYGRKTHFLKPRDAELRGRWEVLHPAVKCVWLVRVKKRVGMMMGVRLRRQARTMVFRTEDLNGKVEEIVEFAGATDWVDLDKAIEIVRGQPGKGSVPKDIVYRLLADHETDVVDVMNGLYDEEVPAL